MDYRFYFISEYLTLTVRRVAVGRQFGFGIHGLDLDKKLLLPNMADFGATL